MKKAVGLGLLAAVVGMGCGGVSDAELGASKAQGQHALALEQVSDGVYELRLSKAALASGTEFLMSTSYTTKTFGDPEFGGMLSRVVFFKRADGKVQLLEAKKGTQIDPGITSANLLMSFPVVSEDETSIGLGFNEGAKYVFASYDWWASDFDSPFGAFLFRNDNIDLKASYVDQGATDAKGRISIRQIALADFWGMADTVELRYAFQPYAPDTSYVPMKSNQDFRRVGFFESSPIVRQGSAEMDYFVARFNPTKPVTFAISANTPPEVKQAIRDGVQYWNRARGKNWVNVIEAPEGVTAPDLDYNLIQWVEEDGAMWAYADAQLDPLTGEVRNAQVFLPSGWYSSSLDDVVGAFARLPNRRSKAALTHAAVSLGHRAKGGAKSARAIGGCNRVNATQLQRAVQVMMRQGLSDAQIQRVTLDWVRSVVAHEVGHTLGLRHNFAGSLGSNIGRAEQDALMKTYYATGTFPSYKLPGSSVMEYPRIEDDFAIGAKIRLGQAALPHDAMAIGVLYEGRPEPTSGPLFCTDMESYFGKSMDCAAFDGRASAFEGLDEDADEAVKNAAVEYLYWLRLAKTYEQRDLFAFNWPEIDAAFAADARYGLTRLLSNKAHTLAADRAFTSVNAVGEKLVHQDSLQRAKLAVLLAGGYEKLFDGLPANFETTFRAQLEQLLTSPWFVSGKTVSGKSWSFTPGELAQIRANAVHYMKPYGEWIQKGDVAALSMSSPLLAFVVEEFPEAADFFMPEELKWEAPALTQSLEKFLGARVQHYLTASSSRQVAKVMVATPPAEGEEPADPVEKTVAFPVFKYDTALRTSAVMIFDPSKSDDRIWAYAERMATSESLTSALDSVSGAPFESMQVDGSSDFAKRWILENREVMGALEGVLPQP